MAKPSGPIPRTWVKGSPLPDIMNPGLYRGIPNEAYHAHPSYSKSGLWTIYSKTPAHFKYPPAKEVSTTQQGNLDFGTALHTAILEPDEFENTVIRGPEDRKGNKWKDLVEIAKIDGRVVLTSDQHDNVKKIRDAVHRDTWLRAIILGGKPEDRFVEASAFGAHAKTGMKIRCRPDLYRRDLGVILDVKSAATAAPDPFARSVVNYGYHVQDPFYSDLMQDLGYPVKAFVFLTFEKESPYATAKYELPPSLVDEGRAIYNRALATAAACEVNKSWPAYPEEVQELSFKSWAYRETEAPVYED